MISNKMFEKLFFILCIWSPYVSYSTAAEDSLSCPSPPSLADNYINSIEHTCSLSLGVDISEVKFEFNNYDTKANKICYINDTQCITDQRNFNSQQCVFIWIHGLNNLDALTSEVRCAISQMTCKSGHKPLFIYINYMYYSDGLDLKDIITIKTFFKETIKYIYPIGYRAGELIAKFLDIVPRDQLQIAGHSLAGPMLGFIGERVIEIRNETLKRLTAVDSVNPGYDNSCPEQQLHSGQAETVVKFYCNACAFGSRLLTADYNFVSGSGYNQDGCAGSEIKDFAVNGIASVCSHLKCVNIAIKTAIDGVRYNAKMCDNYECYHSGLCSGNIAMKVGITDDFDGPPGTYFFDSDAESKSTNLLNIWPN